MRAVNNSFWVGPEMKDEIGTVMAGQTGIGTRIIPVTLVGTWDRSRHRVLCQHFGRN